MANDSAAPFPPHALPHFRIEAFASSSRYSPRKTGRTENPLTHDRAAHSARLTGELSAAFNAARTRVATRTLATHRKRPGVYVELQSVPGQPIPELTWVKKGVRLGAVRTGTDDIQVASLFVPNTAREFLERKLQAYGTELTGAGKIPNREKFETLKQIQPATVSSLWTDSRELPSDADRSVWWECWTWRDFADELRSVAHELDLEINDHSLRFPDLEIILFHGPLKIVEELISQTSSIERLRFATDSPAFFTTVVQRDQFPWVEDLVDRVLPAESGSPAVCLLDTGVARAHPLLEPSIAGNDCLTIDAAWGVDDNSPMGHGTNMAGSILFSDLTYPLSDQEQVKINFVVESVKVIPPPAFAPNGPENYGSITQAAVSIAEINAPHRDRLFCMAITNSDVSGEQPTSWSAALDQICSGSMVGDEGETLKRLFFVSAGNIGDQNGPDDLGDLTEFPVEDPAQSWNAVSVGGFTNKSEIHSADSYSDWTAYAEAGCLSPYSRVSLDWIHGRTPIKPEIVFEAGNRALSPEADELLSGVPSLSLLTTAKDFLTEPLTTFWATSAATAQAAGMAGALMASDESWWPETVRALMIHSASWTSAMQEAFSQCTGKTERIVLARQFGYGVPNFARAVASAQNDLFMISQTELQPYFREILSNERGEYLSAPKLKDMHIYKLPWPSDALHDLGEQEVQLKVTLSYFVEPNLGDLTSQLPGKYRSCGLRFHMKRVGETDAKFQARLNELAREEEDAGSTLEDDSNWHFGPRSVAAGSLHCDVWTGAAQTLAIRDSIAVVPVGGWWKDRVKEKRFDSSIRYALILSISSSDNEALLYSEESQKIETAVAIDVSI